jgi:L-glyceraldehyde 3-phosphate reductase
MTYKADESRYEGMTYNRCGRSGLLLPAISLGMWHNFGSVDDYHNSRSILYHAFDRGITHFDLANNYGPEPGTAEITLGKVLKEGLRAYRDELIISTKAGYYMWPGPYGDWGSRKYLLSSLDQSLKRMDIDYVDIFYSHRPDPNTPLEETMGALSHAVRQGKALYVGLSNYPPELTMKAAAILRQNGTPCVIHQPKYSMFVRNIEDGLLDVVEKEGIGCIAFSPLAQGLLTDRYINGIPKDSRMNRGHFLKPEHLTEEKLNAIIKLNEHAKQRGQSLAQMALAWVLRHSAMTSVLIGASSVNQLEANINALNNSHFSNDELAKIDQILRF